MGFLSSLFGGNKKEINIETSVKSPVEQLDDVPGKKVSSQIQDLVMLSFAESFKVGEKQYPQYLRNKYGIGFPKENLMRLESEGYIRPTSSKESLSHLKVTELKDIASSMGLKVSGKKEELCQRISDNSTEEDLARYVNVRYWIKTGKGEDLLHKNSYISYYTEDHPYSLEAIGLDINSFGKLFSGNKSGRVRDMVWGEFNRLSMKYYKEGMSTGNFGLYCDLLRTMALFLEEEKRYKDALAMYTRFLYYRTNFEASFNAITVYKYSKKVNDAAERLFMGSEIYPFIADEISRMSNGCDFNSKDLHQFMKSVFEKEQDTGIFVPDELAELVMCGMNADKEGQEKICRKAMKASVPKIR